MDTYLESGEKMIKRLLPWPHVQGHTGAYDVKFG